MNTDAGMDSEPDNERDLSALDAEFAALVGDLELPNDLPTDIPADPGSGLVHEMPAPDGQGSAAHNPQTDTGEADTVAMDTDQGEPADASEEKNNTDSPLDQALAQAAAPQLSQRSCRALILTPVASASGLAALGALADLQVQTLDSEAGALIFQDFALSEEQWQMASLLGSEMDPPQELSHLAGQVSALIKAPVVLLTCLLNPAGQSEPGITGQVSARRYVGQKMDAKLPAGLVIARMPAVVEDLLLGRANPGDYQDFQSSNAFSRWQAMKLLGKNLRQARKKGNGQ